ncbi:MAG: type VII toxin-antitoxin system MntA family adenylyltransferase antitoxin [Bacteroidota bacterium]
MNSNTQHPSDIMARLVHALEQDTRIASAYLFGSFGSKHFSAESDVDIGLLFHQDKIPNACAVFELKNEISESIGAEVDLVVLNTSSPIICMQVLRKGKIIFERDRKTRIQFFVRTINSYSDLKMVRAPIEKKILIG